MVDVVPGSEVLACLAVKPRSATLRQVRRQQRRRCRMYPVTPVRRLQRLDEGARVQQFAQRATLVRRQQVPVEALVETRQAGQHAQGFALRRGHRCEQLAFQIALQQLLGGRSGKRHKMQPDSRAPAPGTLHQRVGIGLPVTALDLSHQFGELAPGQRQLPGIHFAKVAGQQQTRQLPGGPAARGHPPAHLRRSHLQQMIEQGIERLAGHVGEVVEHDPQRPVAIRQEGPDRADVGCRHGQGSSQALDEFRHLDGPSVQVQPAEVGPRRAEFGAFAQQHAFPAARRASQQAQAWSALQERQGETWARQMIRWQCGKPAQLVSWQFRIHGNGLWLGCADPRKCMRHR
ncbi:hypothetical protein D9M71_260980 [compost metagenome]